MLFNPDELVRYQRHFSLKEVGTEGQAKLKQASVLCIGAGGLGSPALLYLAAAGVGRIGIVDDDHVELSNLQRQVLYQTQDQKKSKVEIAKQRLVALNENSVIEPYSVHLTADNAFKISENYDLVIDGSDNFATRYLVNDVCYFLEKPYVFASILGFEGQAAVFNPAQGPCYRCLFPAPPAASIVPSCAEAGVLGVLPGMMGVLQASEAIKWILGIGQSLLNRHLVYDVLNQSMKHFPISRKKDCPLCQQQLAFEKLERFDNIECTFDSVDVISIAEFMILKSQNTNISLLDVRQDYERELHHIGGLHIPLGELVSKINTLDKNQTWVVYCQAGKRSEQAVQQLKAAGFNDVKSFAGGMNAWLDAEQQVEHA